MVRSLMLNIVLSAKRLSITFREEGLVMSETVFTEVRYDLNSLVKYIELGEIGLPDIQRPFIWKNAKVRDLFDSMYKGFPIGYLLFWQNALTDDSRAIGVESKQKVPRLLIIDGQQRLTSLYAVLKNIPVIREGYDAEKIKIAFNPVLEKFEVADAAIQRDKAYISDISSIWSNDTDIFDLVDNYLVNLQASREVAEEEKKQIRKTISKLQNLLSFPFTALELSAGITEEQVANVFVRINSMGTPLNQADFILTLMSVFWDDGRTQLESFCREARRPGVGLSSPYNHFIHPDPDQLLRVCVGLGFKRARLQYVYSILRGKDLDTEQFSEERRVEQFDILKRAQDRVLYLQYWHDFMKAIRQAGFCSMKMISSQNNLLFSYIIYLIGRTEFHVEEFTLRRVIARWFFMSSLTGRFTGSPESAMEFDLARFRDVKDADTFVKILDRICDTSLTDDFWSISLPNELSTSSPRSPSLFAYQAALVLLNANALFSQLRVSDLFDPSVQANRASIEKHHLFPRSYLKSRGISSIRDTNQIANFALVEWGDNAEISNKAPAEYVPVLTQRFNQLQLKNMYFWHALPDGWESLEYNEFLVRRRVMIAKVIKEGFQYLSSEASPEIETIVPLSIEELALTGETTEVEFKSTLRVNLHTGQKDPRMELACIKTIAGFINTKGGTLIVGVTNDGISLGLGSDQFASEDKMALHLANLINEKIGPQHMINIHPRFDDHNGKRVLLVECWASKIPVFVKEENDVRFYIRTGTSTTELNPSQTHDFIKQRFEK